MGFFQELLSAVVDPEPPPKRNEDADVPPLLHEPLQNGAGDAMPDGSSRSEVRVAQFEEDRKSRSAETTSRRLDFKAAEPRGAQTRSSKASKKRSSHLDESVDERERLSSHFYFECAHSWWHGERMQSGVVEKEATKEIMTNNENITPGVGKKGSRAPEGPAVQ